MVPPNSGRSTPPPPRGRHGVAERAVQAHNCVRGSGVRQRTRRGADAAMRRVPTSASAPAMIMAGTTCENIITAQVTAQIGTSEPTSAHRAQLPRTAARARTYVDRQFLELLQPRPRAGRRHRRRISCSRCARPSTRRLRRSHAPRRRPRLPPSRHRVGTALLLPQPVPRLGRDEDADQRSRPLVPARRAAEAPRSAGA